MKQKLIITLFSLIMFNPIAVNASEGITIGQQVINAFARTCLSHIWRPDELKVKLKPGNSLHLRKLPEKMAQDFLGKHSGDGWFLPKSFGHGIMLLNDLGECTFIISKWKELDFASKLKKMFKELAIYSLKEIKRTDGPKAAITWALFPVGDHKRKIEAENLGAGIPSLILQLFIPSKPEGRGTFVLSLAKPRFGEKTK